MSEIDLIFSFLSKEFKLLSKHLKYRYKTDSNEELIGTKPTMQGKQKVEGFYFASIVKKPADVRLYFFPIYTHDTQFSYLSPELRKMLKGKSCFHVNKLDENLKIEISNLLNQGLKIYLDEGLV